MKGCAMTCCHHVPWQQVLLSNCDWTVEFLRNAVGGQKSRLIKFISSKESSESVNMSAERNPAFINFRFLHQSFLLFRRLQNQLIGRFEFSRTRRSSFIIIVFISRINKHLNCIRLVLSVVDFIHLNQFLPTYSLQLSSAIKEILQHVKNVEHNCQ